MLTALSPRITKILCILYYVTATVKLSLEDASEKRWFISKCQVLQVRGGMAIILDLLQTQNMLQ